MHPPGSRSCSSSTWKLFKCFNFTRSRMGNGRMGLKLGQPFELLSALTAFSANPTQQLVHVCYMSITWLARTSKITFTTTSATGGVVYPASMPTAMVKTAYDERTSGYKSGLLRASASVTTSTLNVVPQAPSVMTHFEAINERQHTPTREAICHSADPRQKGWGGFGGISTAGSVLRESFSPPREGPGQQSKQHLSYAKKRLRKGGAAMLGLAHKSRRLTTV